MKVPGQSSRLPRQSQHLWLFTVCLVITFCCCTRRCKLLVWSTWVLKYRSTVQMVCKSKPIENKKLSW